MNVLFFIDNQQRRMAKSLKELLAQCGVKLLNITRTESSALDPEPQPYQDFIDRVLYRLAGLRDAEAQGFERQLESRL